MFSMHTRNHASSTLRSPTVNCAACAACCCRLEVLLTGDDDVALRLTVDDPRGGTSMRRFDDGWCAALDRDTLRCAIYARRPALCREFAEGGDDCIEQRSRCAAPQSS
ncbi:MAG: YkgJ family cysteine cluster protein [Burkholderiales bacterium]|nr:YkgJ family cysteine cluster protein [Burkholderiales bacterium]